MKLIKNFLFKNTNQKQTIFKNTFWLTIAEVFTRLLKFFLVIYIVRILGATEYGKFTFAFSFASLLTIISSMGLPAIVIREFARDKKKEKHFPTIISLKLFLSALGVLVLSVGSLFITDDPSIRRIMLMLIFYTFIADFGVIFYAFFKARQRMEYESWTKIIQAFVLVSSGFLAIYCLPSIVSLTYAYILSAIISFVVISWFFYSKVSHFKLSLDKKVWKYFLGLSWPLALVTGLDIVYSSTDSVMLGYFKQITETGYYNAAYKIIGMVVLPMNLIIQSFYPALGSCLKVKERFKKIWKFEMKIMTFLAIPITIGGIVLAPKIIQFIYGKDFLPAVFAFQILFIKAALLYFYSPYRETMIIFNLQRRLFKIIFLSACLNIVLNYFLIPLYSLNGAAMATATTQFVVLTALILLVSKNTFLSFLKTFLTRFSLVCFLASLVMLLLIINIDFHVVAMILLGGLAYLSSFALFYKLIVKKT